MAKEVKEAERVEPKYAGLNIHQRLHAVMQSIDYVQKEDKKVNNQYTFVSHDAVTAKCRKAFIENGVITIPTITEHSFEWCTRKKKAWINKVETLVDEPVLRTTVQVKIDFINIDNPQEIVTTTSYGYGLDDQDKGLGKAYSYAVKYGYLKALGLETGDDPEREIHQEVSPISNATSMAYDPEQNQQAYEYALKYISGCDNEEKVDSFLEKNKNKLKNLPKEMHEDVLAAASVHKTDLKSKLNGVHV